LLEALSPGRPPGARRPYRTAPGHAATDSDGARAAAAHPTRPRADVRPARRRTAVEPRAPADGAGRGGGHRRRPPVARGAPHRRAAL
ncbi:MAG: hypothetical protein AVDCRST_MAG38-2250, partial [uncultured Solirubrobacteraceae bacterium]